MIAFVALQIGLSEITANRADGTILPVVEFRQMDVREALRSLFRQGRFGGTIAPDVQGVVTMSLRNVSWSTALQNVTRMVDATYRIDHGFFEVVRREEPVALGVSEPDPREETIREAYRSIERGIVAGRRAELSAFLDPAFEVRNATETQKGERGVRSFIEAFRAYPSVKIERFEWGGKSVADAEVLVSYRRAGAAPIYYRDLWRKFPNDLWQLSWREETSLSPSLRFVNVPVSAVVERVFRRLGVSWAFDSALDRNRRITVDLTGLPFEVALGKVMTLIGATYRIEGGVYQIVPREQP